MEKTTALKKLIAVTLAMLFVVAFISWFFDIFYQYHMPFLGMTPVFNDRDNQMPGSVRHMKYDSVLIGSSVAENFDTDYLDSVYGSQTIKIVKGSGTYTQLKYYLDMAEDSHTLKRVIWCFDIWSANCEEGNDQLYDRTTRYLHTPAVIDDVPYLFNKDILFKKIPEWCAFLAIGRNTGGSAYNWGDGKTFSREFILSQYTREYVDPSEIVIEDPAVYTDNINRSFNDLLNEVNSHPDIDYVFLFPPYSMLWWDAAYIGGMYEEHMYSLEVFMDKILPCKNVSAYFFADDREIVCNLDNYMDLVHYSPDINQMMLEKMTAGECDMKKLTYEEIRARMDELTAYIEQEEIPMLIYETTGSQ